MVISTKICEESLTRVDIQVSPDEVSDKKVERVEKKLLHYIGKGINDFNLIEPGDRIMVGVSGGKDSYTLLHMLHKLRRKYKYSFEIHAYTLDQVQPGWNDSGLREWLELNKYEYTIEARDTYSIVKDKIPEGKTYCSLCSRLRRGNIYRFAKDNGYNKIALGHHRDDLIQSLLMGIFFNGEIKSMPAKLLTQDKELLVIRPMIYCQEKDIKEYATYLKFPIIPCNLCGSQENLSRKKVARLIEALAAENPKVPSNMLRSLSNVRVSHLLDDNLFDFKELSAEVEFETA